MSAVNTRLPGGKRVTRADLQDRRRVIDAAVEQGRIAHRQLQRRDGDALAEADRHRLERAPARARSERTAALLQLDLGLVEEAHLLEPSLLPVLAQLVGDLRHSDVGAFHHDFGDRALAAERMRVVNEMAVGRQNLWAIHDLRGSGDDARIHRHGERERLEGRSQLEHAERRAVEHLIGSRLAPARWG